MTTRVAFLGGSWSPEARFDHEVTYLGCPGQAKADLGPIQPNPGQPGLGQRSKPEPGWLEPGRSEPVVGEFLEAGEAVV